MPTRAPFAIGEKSTGAISLPLQMYGFHLEDFPREIDLTGFDQSDHRSEIAAGVLDRIRSWRWPRLHLHHVNERGRRTERPDFTGCFLPAGRGHPKSAPHARHAHNQVSVAADVAYKLHRIGASCPQIAGV